MYKIGEFSKITQTPIRTLRFYDKIGILNPDEIDIYTGYRYYSDAKIEELNVIKELKNIDFTLEEIKLYWDKFDDDKMLKKKQELLDKQIAISSKIKRLDYLRKYVHGGKIIIGEEFNLKPRIMTLKK
ncbi:MAG: MerR family transcriptional regulator [Clostridia bacterium]